MKKVLLSLGVVAAMAMTSCGGHDFCSCAETYQSMMEEAKEAGGDEEKMKEIKEKYEGDKEACEKVMEGLEKDMEGLSDEEKDAKEEEMKADCPAYKELSEAMGH